MHSSEECLHQLLTLVSFYSLSMDSKASRVFECISLSEGRVAQKDLVIALASGSPGSVAQKAFDTSKTSLSEGSVAQNALVKFSSTFSLPGFNGLIFVLSPPLGFSLYVMQPFKLFGSDRGYSFWFFLHLLHV